MAKACRSKYLGTKVRLRGREATISGCARPKVNAPPKAPQSRFRVTYPSGNQRPVLRSAVYRAARCAAKPHARGCAPLDIERAPWLAKRQVDTSFDFGFSPSTPAPKAPPRERRRLPEMQAPRRLPSPPHLALLQPESQPWARWLAYAMPKAWQRLATEITWLHGLDHNTLQPLTRDQRAARYGYDYRGGYGSAPTPNVPRPSLDTGSHWSAVGGYGKHAHESAAIRPSANQFVEDASTLGKAIFAWEHGLASGVFRRDASGHLVLHPQTRPEDIHIPPRTHGSTAAMMRRRQAEQNEKERSALARAVGLAKKADAIVAKWSADPSALVPDPIAFPHATGYMSHPSEGYASTWAYGGRDWRLRITSPKEVILDVWDGAWREAWRGRYDLRHDRIDLSGASPEVVEAIGALHREGGAQWQIPRIFGGGRTARRDRVLKRAEKGETGPRREDCEVHDLGLDATDAIDLTRRMACAGADAAARIRPLRDRALAAACRDADSDECESIYAQLEACGAATCPPAGMTAEAARDGACPHVLTGAWKGDAKRGVEPLPDALYDTDKPHRIGAHRLCYYGESMRARRALRLAAEMEARTRVPPTVARRGEGAIEEWVVEAVREAERADPRADEWRGNDNDILGPIRRQLGAMGAAEQDSAENLAFRLLYESEHGGRATMLDENQWNAEITGYSGRDNVAEALWLNWSEEQSSKPMGKAAVAKLKKKYTNYMGQRFGVVAAAEEIARGILSDIRSGKRMVAAAQRFR